MNKKLKISIKKYVNDKLVHQKCSFLEFSDSAEIIFKFTLIPIMIYINFVMLLLYFFTFILKTINKLISIFKKN